MRLYNKRLLTTSFMVVLPVALLACGGGSDDDSAAEVPSFAGTYDVSYTKTSDTCASGAAKTAKATQTVTQSGRNVTLVSNTLTLLGSVDADNAGLSMSAQSTTSGVVATTSAVYRTTSTPGVYGAGLSVVARAGSTLCSISYNGQAKRRPIIG